MSATVFDRYKQACEVYVEKERDLLRFLDTVFVSTGPAAIARLQYLRLKRDVALEEYQRAEEALCSTLAALLP